MAYYSVRLTARAGVSTDLTGYTRQINERLRVVNKNAQVLHHVLDNTMQAIVEAMFPTMKHVVQTITILKDDQAYATVDSFGWAFTATAAPTDLDTSKIILLEG